MVIMSFGLELNGVEQEVYKTIKQKRLEHEEASMDHSIIPQLVEDTFFDRLLGHSVDGINISSLISVRDTSELCGEGKASTSCRIFNKINDVGLNSSRSLIPANVKKLKGNHKFGYSWIASGFKYNLSMPAYVQTTTHYGEHGFRTKKRFMLPSDKTIFDVDIDSLEKKLWRNPYAELSDFFNYELDEKQWKHYCKMVQSHIRAQNAIRNLSSPRTHEA